MWEEQVRDDYSKDRCKVVPMTSKEIKDMYGEEKGAKTIQSLEMRGSWKDDPNVDGEKIYLLRKDLHECGNTLSDRSLSELL